jgi:hypothetical protein
MLKRKIMARLHSWAKGSRKALIVTGARQIGKSTSIRTFGEKHFGTYFEANLLLDLDALDTLTGSRNATDFINRISLLAKTPLVEGDTLIFIDEIQEYPEIVTLAKALVEDGRYRYAFSGSMLGTEFKGITSFPVGFVEQLVMRPMDFEEFCWAVGVGDTTLGDLRTCLRDERAPEGYLHEAMLRNFRAYLLTGGMPEVVQAYVDSGYSLATIRELQDQLNGQYRHDISKYAGTRAFQVREIFDLLPAQLEEDPRRFTFATLKKQARYSQYDKDFLWLVNAGVALMVRQATEARAPLKRTELPERFKLYQSDTGMLLSRYPQSTARAVYLDRASQNLGGIFENAVAQELAAAGIPLWYYASEDVGEVDFLMEGKGGHVVPIEVKSGRKVRSHAALDRLLGIENYKIRDAIVLSRNQLERDGHILYVPLYMTFCIDEFVNREAGDFSFAPIAL